ncbi:MAG: segregation/condensation protein A [Candidatus Magasanikbacteria bacterium]|jgi:segregation and condensation protein A|nr:segregation/condensation protein A [Candidatus Magasanikbacteria bacterium]MBT4314630.1 segregation/condensation protein A [Candidatus Magasanikbacteria bacterium]MBT4547051.1 segregation/condensation protein A [Candidatus Magasanikbacteria bacterium]MBT6819511.1 segregation/condensation protein A [Candidatus Magasanikbacteria bacterium]
MNAEFKLQQFSGPLDLLLSLIDDKKLSVSELSLSEVTEQFLVHLDKIEDKKPEDFADFLVVATRLLFIKSNRLLPQFAIEEEEGPSLEDQLRVYRAFVDASKKLNKLWLSPNRSVFRSEPPRKIEEFVASENLATNNLLESFANLLKKIEPPKPLPKTHIDKNVSVKETIERIRKILNSGKNTSFSSVLQDSKNRTEVIIGFLALLELVKGKSVALKQNKNFSDILINKV